MKRTLLDIVKKISISTKRVKLVPKDLTHPEYFIYEAVGWKLVDILREIEYRTTQDRLDIKVNSQSIEPRDYVYEQGVSGILVKFKKSNFEFNLDDDDYTEIKGDIEQYA
jgi:hypothetical protein